MTSSRYGFRALLRLTKALEAKCARLEGRLRAALAQAPAPALAGLPYHLVLRFGPEAGAARD